VKSFYSAQEIEDLHRQGVRELVVDDSMVLTDLARQTAGQLGLRLVPARSPEAPRSPGAAGSAAPARPAADGAVRPPAVVAPAPLPARPKGCQHGAVMGGQQATPGSSTSMVDDLVGLVKQMSKR
jgi:hypothetical protein